MTTEDISKTNSKKNRWAFITLTVIFFVILCGFAWVVHDIQRISNNTVQLLENNNNLIKENNNRISEIQQSRIESCKQTYEAFRKVFTPFFPPEPRTPKQQADLDKFNRIIDKFLDKCQMQVQIKP